MSYLKFTKELKNFSCYFLRVGKGSHMIWYNPATNMQSPVPNHKNIPLGTRKAIIRQLGIA